ncbi:hypothetical protein KP509_15G020200 [Ceratopteris richardii]|uniref:VQ domain-containing protein n=1 Tax=Ceratopteris richardii TaxID=49495 RepID=A0A8T2T537_CERRI|nr:hypothetical protein KP509_15G020200 [Ceratopteris richardii]
MTPSPSVKRMLQKAPFPQQRLGTGKPIALKRTRTSNTCSAQKFPNSSPRPKPIGGGRPTSLNNSNTTTTHLCAVNLSHFQEMVHRFTGAPSSDVYPPNYPSPVMASPLGSVSQLATYAPSSVGNVVSSRLLLNNSLPLQLHGTSRNEADILFDPCASFVNRSSNKDPLTDVSHITSAYPKCMSGSDYQSLLQQSNGALVINPSMLPRSSYVAPTYQRFFLSDATYAAQNSHQVAQTDSNMTPISSILQPTSMDMDFNSTFFNPRLW